LPSNTRQAVLLSKNAPAYRQLLGGHLRNLAEVNLKLGAYDEASRLALDLPKVVTAVGRAQGCFDAARILAHLLTRVDGDPKLTPADRDRLTRSHLGHTIVLLREAIDGNPRLIEEVETDTTFERVRPHPAFKLLITR